MDAQSDFKELLALFNAHKVQYLIVGGYALALHGSPRNTGDIDLFVKASGDNAKRIIQALEEFGFGGLGLKEKDFIRANQVIQLGVPPVRVDLITSLYRCFLAIRLCAKSCWKIRRHSCIFFEPQTFAQE